jgi:hypothetical protein
LAPIFCKKRQTSIRQITKKILAKIRKKAAYNSSWRDMFLVFNRQAVLATAVDAKSNCDSRDKCPCAFADFFSP